MIWTDCDREGEHIGSEVADICRKANPRIIVKRARFSAIIAKFVVLPSRLRAELTKGMQSDQPCGEEPRQPRYATSERRLSSNGPRPPRRCSSHSHANDGPSKPLR